ncbi:sorbitol dehydrogenase-like [Symsagittifera roscoffensis]|uniref:sorbitol dehydrogenase-like n=1 Tax=Symsagittifera roscoffensis TaxID=84072 RepID=UPI00307B9F95
MAPIVEKENLSALLVKKDDLQIVNLDIPKPKSSQVLLRMGPVGICGSDVHYLKHMQIGSFIVKEPMILGHESAGTVLEVGSEVKTLKVGDRVAIEPGVPCGRCSFCVGGNYNLCPDVEFLATPPYHGSLRQYHCHEAAFCFKLPENVSLEEGALLEPLSVGVHANRKAEVTFGDLVLVCGAGPIGLVNVMVAKAAGASLVVCTDIDDKRLDFALNCGSDKVLNVRGLSEITAAEKIIELLQNRRPNRVIECSGAQSSARAAIHAIAAGGKMALVGLAPSDDLTLPMITASCKEVSITGVFRYANCYPTALNLVASGKVDVKKLVTHRFDLKDSIKAFATTFNGEGVKVVINCS